MLNVKFSDIATFSYGKMPNKNLVLENGKYPIFSGYQITGHYDTYNSDADELVLIARGVGGTGEIRKTPSRCWLTNLSIKISLFSKNVLKDYLFYKFQAKDLRWLNSGSAQPQITISDLSAIDLSLPSLEEQRHIVDTIGSVDDLIEKNEEIIEKAKAIIDQFYSSTIVEEKQSTLKDFFDITIGRTPPTKENRWFSVRRKENVCWLSIKDMAQNATFIFETSQYLTREAITKFRIPIVEEGDVLLSFKLTVGRTAIAGTKMVTNEAIACFKCKAEYRNYLLCYLQNCDFMSDGGNTSSIGKAINSTIIKNFPFAIPTDNSLNKFNNNTGPFFKLIKYKQRENMILKTQKERLLSKYFGSN